MTKIKRSKKGGISTEAIVVKCEIAYPSLLETHIDQDGDDTKKYMVTCVFEKDDPQLDKLKKLIDQVSMELLGRPDSENKNPRIKLKREGVLEGKYVMKCNRMEERGKPPVVDSDKVRMTEDAIREVGGSSICNVAFTLFGYNKKGKGVGAILEAMQVIKAKSYSPSVEDLFENVNLSLFEEGATEQNDDMAML